MAGKNCSYWHCQRLRPPLQRSPFWIPDLPVASSLFAFPSPNARLQLKRLGTSQVVYDVRTDLYMKLHTELGRLCFDFKYTYSSVRRATCNTV